MCNVAWWVDEGEMSHHPCDDVSDVWGSHELEVAKQGPGPTQAAHGRSGTPTAAMLNVACDTWYIHTCVGTYVRRFYAFPC